MDNKITPENVNEDSEHLAAFADWQKATEQNAGVTQVNHDGTVELHTDIQEAIKANQEDSEQE